MADDNDAARVCDALLSSLPSGHVLFPGSAAYDSSISSYAYAEIRLLPTCIASPRSADDVSTIIKILGQFSSVAFAIKSGGHSINKGFANIVDGITIDLGGLNAVQLNHDKTSVSIGAGNRWKSVYSALEPHGISVQGGRVSTVGVGGLITGGGLGYFSPRLGWVCDSVLNFEIVLANGDIVNANATSHNDLFTALKGGQNNFGVVTRFDLKMVLQDSLWGGIILYSDTTDKAILDAFTNFKDPAKFDADAMIILIFSYKAVSNKFGALAAVYHARPDLAKGSTLEAFANIKPQLYNSLRVASIGSFAREQSLEGVLEVNTSWATTTFAMSPSILLRVNDLFRRTSIALKDRYNSPTFASDLVFQSVPAVVAESANSLGFDSSSHPEYDLINVLVILSSEDDCIADELNGETRKLLEEIDVIAKEEGVKRDHIYLNYAGAWQDVFNGYGEGSVERMKAVARKYDEKGMFQKQVRGGFRLFA